MKLTVSLTKQLKTGTVNVSFSVENSIMGILGQSGSGKSVTLRMIAGILQPDAGKLTLNDSVLYDSEQHIYTKPQKRNIGYLFQNYALFPNMTVSQNIAFGMGKKQNKEYVQQLIERFYLTEVAHVKPTFLSGGQQQRVAIARMLAAKPSVILLDEPFSALDIFLRKKMIQHMKTVLQEFGGIGIVVSHDCREIAALTQQCMVMENGRIVEQCETQQILKYPQTTAAKKLIQGSETYDLFR